jgi:uncharacterized protein
MSAVRLNAPILTSAPERRLIDGPAGPLECLLEPGAAGMPARGLGLVCHPHPLHGGSMDNKVAQTLARGFAQAGWRALRFNFRGVGASQGQWAEGAGEIDDALAVLNAYRQPGEALVLGGFSFGAFVASQVAARLHGSDAPRRVVLLGAAAGSFDVAPVPADSLVIHGEADDVIPLAAVLDWARPQQLPVLVFPGTGHFFHGQLVRLRGLIAQAVSAPALP